jgi:hypothetical protein
VPATLRAADKLAEHVCVANIDNVQCLRLELAFGGAVETAHVRAVTDLFAPAGSKKSALEEAAQLKAQLSSLPSRISVIEQAKQMGLKDDELYRWRCETCRQRLFR